MKVLIFQAAVSAIAVAAMNRLADEVRREGHTVGVRSLPHFRREKEPADRIIVALSPLQARQYRNLGAELVQTFQDTELFIPLELPEERDKENSLEDFEFDDVVEKLDRAGPGFMTMEQLRAEAIERGLEVTPNMTREQLEHAIGIDIHPGPQEGDRISDRLNSESAADERIGLRVSTVLPTPNGIDISRMNDEQLRAVAANLGLRVSTNASRQTLVNKITKTFAEKVADAETADKVASDLDVEANADLVDKDADQLKAIAEAEEIDVGRATSVEGLTEKIVEARKAKAGDNGTA